MIRTLVLALIFTTKLFSQNQILATVGPTTATFTDSTVVDGQGYAYWATAVGPACPAQPVCGESTPSNVAVSVVPGTGSHTVTLTWTLSTSSGVVSQNLYRAQVPASPTGLTAKTN